MTRTMAVAATMTLLWLASSAGQSPKGEPKSVPSPKKVPTVGIGRMATPGEDAEIIDADTPAGSEKPYLSQLMAFKKANDRVGIDRLKEMRRGYLLPSATKLLVIQAHLGKVVTMSSEAYDRELRSGGGRVELETTEVRVIDGPFKDLVLHVPVESIALMRVDVSEENRKKRAAEKKSKDDAAEAAKAKMSLPENRAASLLAIAKNLEKSGKTKPALENYRKIVAEFGGTASAKEAGERIKALTGK